MGNPMLPRYPGEGGKKRIFWEKGTHPVLQQGGENLNVAFVAHPEPHRPVVTRGGGQPDVPRAV